MKTERSRLYAHDIVMMREAIFKKWNIYLLSLGNIIVETSKVTAPRIGLCANTIKVSGSKIDANFKGCKPDHGLGNLPRLANCSGAGASHGGAGGYGAPETTVKKLVAQCLKV